MCADWPHYLCVKPQEIGDWPSTSRGIVTAPISMATSGTSMRFALNPLAEHSAYTAEEAEIVSCESAGRARHEISRWPGYAVTPLRSLEGLAGHVGVASVLYKDEGERLGQRSFKALGVPMPPCCACGVTRGASRQLSAALLTGITGRR